MDRFVTVLALSLFFGSAAVADESIIQETMSADEPQAIEQIVALATQKVRDEQTLAPDGIARRDAHAKAHGCVQAKFIVNENIPSNLHVGVFAATEPFNAIVRFSN